VDGVPTGRLCSELSSLFASVGLVVINTHTGRRVDCQEPQLWRDKDTSKVIFTKISARHELRG
jgi:hypothetical protein